MLVRPALLLLLACAPSWAGLPADFMGVVSWEGGAPVVPHDLSAVPEFKGEEVKGTSLWLHSSDFDEEYRGIFKDVQGAPVQAERDKIDRLMRSKGSGEVTGISLELLELLARMQAAFKGARIEVVCGYRSPQRNAALRKRNKRVAKESYHIDGMAADIRIPGVPAKKLRDFARSLEAGGVGYYPKKGFIHVDVGPVRTW